MKKSYQQFCGVAKALDVVGERWTLLIVRNLLVGGQRYADLMATLPGITTNLLAQRLRDLVAAGLIEQRELPAPAKATVYELTSAGRELEPAVLALGRFGARYLDAPAKGDRTHLRWAMVSLMRRYRGSSLPGKLVLQIDQTNHFTLQLTADALHVQQGAEPDVEATVSLGMGTLRALLFAGASFDAHVANGDVTIHGSRALAKRAMRSVGVAG